MPTKAKVPSTKVDQLGKKKQTSQDIDASMEDTNTGTKKATKVQTSKKTLQKITKRTKF